MCTNMSLRVNPLLLQCLSDSFERLMMFVHGFDVAMTVVLDIIQFVQRIGDCCDGCYLTSDVAMIVVIDIIQFFQLSDYRRDGCYPFLLDFSNIEMTTVFV